MSAMQALLRCLEPIEDATQTRDGHVTPDWTWLDDDHNVERLSDGERTLVWAGLQLWNGGGNNIPGRPADLHQALCHLDDANRRRLLLAIADVWGWTLTIGVPIAESVAAMAERRVAEHRGDRDYLTGQSSCD